MNVKKLAARKKKRPHFKRSNCGRPDMKSVKDVWRRPRGIDNKQREQKKAAGPIPSIGWRNSRDIRGVHPSGFVECRVHNIAELKNLESEKHAVMVASSVGGKKRLEIIAEAKKKNLKILNA